MNNVERMTMIVEGVIDATPAPALLDKIGDHFSAHYRVEIIRKGWDPDALTNEQRAAVFVDGVRTFGKNIMGEGAAAAKVAELASDFAVLEAQIAAARQAAESEI